MYEFSREDSNAYIEQRATKEYGWDDWLDDFPNFIHQRAYYGRRDSQQCLKKRPQEIKPIKNRSFRLSEHRKRFV